MPGLGEHRMSPWCACAHRECWRAITADRDPADIFKNGLGARYIIAEFSFRQRMNRRMPVAVAGQLVPGIDDPPDQRRMALGDPTEGEECPTRTGGGELGQDAVGIALDPARETIPIRTFDGPGKCLDLEIILHVHAHRVDQSDGRGDFADSGRRAHDVHSLVALKPLNTSINLWNTRSRRDGLFE